MQIQDIVAMIIIVAGLIFLTVEDLLHKKISPSIIIAMGIALLATSFWLGKSYKFILPGLVPGGLAIVFSLLTKGGFGLGDALLLLATGSYLGLWDSLAVLMIGLILSSLAGIILLVCKKANLKTELPFIPFYFGGILVWGVSKWAF